MENSTAFKNTASPFHVFSVIMWYGPLTTSYFENSGLGIGQLVGWALCNGQNGTNDLRGRFLVGAGDKYQYSETGGEAKVALNNQQIPSHGHSINNGDFGTLGIGIDTDSSSTYIPYCTTGRTGALDTDETGNSPADKHNNLPPYMGIYYLQKI